MQFRCLNKYFLIILLLAFAFHNSHAADTLRTALNVYRDYDVTHYDLLVRVDPQAKMIYGINQITFKAPFKMYRVQVDLFENFEVRGVMQSGKWCHFERKKDHIFVDLVETIEKGQTGIIEVNYAGSPQAAIKPPWDGGFVWTTDSAGKPWVTVACEGLGASSWWPCKDHLSDEPDSMNISIEVPYGLRAISNGTFVDAQDQSNGYMRFNWKVNYPINTYNVTLNIGDYNSIHDTFNSKAGALSLDYYVLPYHLKKAENYFSKQVKPMLKCFEQYFGAYPFTKDGYALVETPYWGMEHQSAVAYGNNFKINEYGFDFIIVHESAHEWWGNAVSVPDAAEMWLHEAFATYAERLYLECTQGEKIANNYFVMQREKIKNEEAMLGPMNVNYHQRPDNDIYYKGAWMLHTLRNMLQNDSLFMNILYSFQQKYKYQIANTSDFIQITDSLTNGDYHAFFRQYLEFASIPELHYSIKKDKKRIKISYRLKSDVPDLSMPIQLLEGNEVIILNADDNEKTFILKGNKLSEIRIKPNSYLIKEIRNEK